MTRVGVLLIGAALAGALPVHAQRTAGLEKIQTVVMIYAENRSFDNLYGGFPGANGLADLSAAPQLDRDGTPLKELPPVWGGLTAKGYSPAVPQAATEHLPPAPFTVDDPKGLNTGVAVPTHDLWHRFYQNQMQIHGGRNDGFVAWADSGGLVMGYYDGSKLPLWSVARKYVLADNFFTGAFGGSFLNHIYLVCACAPFYPDAARSPARPSIAAVEPDGVTLKTAPGSPKSALDGIPIFVSDGNITPDGYAVNTMQPPYQPSANKPASGGDPAYADPGAPTTMPPQHEQTIGDLLSAKGVSWVWYAGAWQAALDGKGGAPVPYFQYHHQPFNYFANYAPGGAARAEHLKDGGMNGEAFIRAIDQGTLPQVVFYKPQGNLNEHAGYTDILSGDQHLADVVAHLEKSPQWAHMLVLITYDENGGWWDHVKPPKADRWGPGNRLPALIISPYARGGTVDHTQYDTDSFLRVVTLRFGLPELAGLKVRDDALKANGEPPMGDLTAALDLSK
jgi:phospholipase C